MADFPDTPAAPDNAGRKPISMHDNVPDWYDCCSCEAEPYWAELEEVPKEGVNCNINANTPPHLAINTQGKSL